MDPGFINFNQNDVDSTQVAVMIMKLVRQSPLGQ